MAEVKQFDVVIIGGGPAGASAAKRACDKGLSVALIDRSVFPRHKLCGALLSGRGHRALKDIFDLAPDKDMFLYSDQVAFKWDGEELCRFTAPYELTYTYRRDFDHWLLKAAIAAGTVDYQGHRVECFDTDNNRLELEDGSVLGYKVLIGADGAASPVAKHLFGRAHNPDTMGFAFEVEAEPAQDDGALMSIDFAIVNWGYGWNFPKRGSQTIGIGALQRVDQDLKALMRKYVAAEGADPEAYKVKGAFIPLGDYKKKPGRDNILLAGDAAGLVDGMTGEGIALAMESGAEAAEAAAEVIAAGAPDKAFKAYLPRIKYLHTDLDKSNRLRQLIYASHLRSMIKDKLAHSVGARESFFALLNGDISYAELEKRVAKQTIAKLRGGLNIWPKIVRSKLGGGE